MPYRLVIHYFFLDIVTNVTFQRCFTENIWFSHYYVYYFFHNIPVDDSTKEQQSMEVVVKHILVIILHRVVKNAFFVVSIVSCMPCSPRLRCILETIAWWLSNLSILYIKPDKIAKLSRWVTTKLF